jgi:transposase
VGTKVYQEKMFYNFSLSERVPPDHFLRKVAKVVDLSFVWFDKLTTLSKVEGRKLVKPYYSYTGQSSIDPLVLFKMTLIGYFYGITSERRLAEETSLNMAFMQRLYLPRLKTLMG